MRRGDDCSIALFGSWIEADSPIDSLPFRSDAIAFELLSLSQFAATRYWLHGDAYRSPPDAATGRAARRAKGSRRLEHEFWRIHLKRGRLFASHRIRLAIKSRWCFLPLTYFCVCRRIMTSQLFSDGPGA